MADTSHSAEIWRAIDEAPEYAVSDLGRVKRIIPDRFRRPLRVLRTPVGSQGYLVCSLHTKGRPQLHRKVHVLVCTAFHGPKPTPRHEVRHLDGNPLNACAGNLAWGTSKENAADCLRHGTFPRGERSPHAKLTDAQVAEIRASHEHYRSVAEKFGISPNYVHQVRRAEPRAK
jgi:hypothetical protein